MQYAEEYKKLDPVTFIDKYGIVAFLDEFMEDADGRHERYEKWRQENKSCKNCKYCTKNECEYWGDFINSNDLCCQWK